MIIVNDENENSTVTSKIMTMTADVCKWRTLMGRPICDCGWSAIDDYEKGSGYIDHTPWIVFKMHVQDKHNIHLKLFTENKK